MYKIMDEKNYFTLGKISFMKKLLFIVFISVSLFYSCGNNSANQQTGNTSDSGLDKSFNRYKEAFIEDMWKLYPGWASSQGYHKYDSVLVVPDEAFHKKEVAFANQNLDSLKKFDISKLSSSNKTDFYILENALNGFLFNEIGRAS